MSLYRTIFGPSADEVWGEFSPMVQGSFVPGGFWGWPSVFFQHAGYELTLDVQRVSTGKSNVKYTRFRTTGRNLRGLSFRLSRRGILSNVAAWFGAEQTRLGDPAFDHAYVLKGTEPELQRALFRHPAVRELLGPESRMAFELVRDTSMFGSSLPETQIELRYRVLGVIKDMPQLTRLAALMTTTLDCLSAMGCLAPLG